MANHRMETEGGSETNASLGGSLLGIDMNRMSLPRLLNATKETIVNRTNQTIFACANPHSLVSMKSDAEFRRALEEAEIVVVDGVGVALAGLVIRRRLGPRISGAEYHFGLCDLLNSLQGQGQRKFRVFYFGSSTSVLEKIAQKFADEFPNLELCGTLSPPFGEWDPHYDTELIDVINDAEPDVLWVGMTAPKQEKWVNRNRNRLNASVIGSIGAVFDFYAGTHPRAPRILREFGLEWLYRLCREPRRLWRRTIVSAPLFFLEVIRYHLISSRD